MNREVLKYCIEYQTALLAKAKLSGEWDKVSFHRRSIYGMRQALKFKH